MYAAITILFLAVLARAVPMPLSAATGAGGTAEGGSVNSLDSPSLLNVLSYNGGGSGDASSGDASAIDDSRTGSPGDSQFEQTADTGEEGVSILDLIPGLTDNDERSGAAIY